MPLFTSYQVCHKSSRQKFPVKISRKPRTSSLICLNQFAKANFFVRKPTFQCLSVAWILYTVESTECQWMPGEQPATSNRDSQWAVDARGLLMFGLFLDQLSNLAEECTFFNYIWKKRSIFENDRNDAHTASSFHHFFVENLPSFLWGFLLRFVDNKKSWSTIWIFYWNSFRVLKIAYHRSIRLNRWLSDNRYLDAQLIGSFQTYE